MMTPVDNFGSEEIYNTVRRESGSMPNGRSGGFRISLAQLRKLLQGLPGETRVGSVFGKRGAKSVTATEFAQRLDRQGEEDLPVEEQDHRWYIAPPRGGSQGLDSYRGG